jgi:uncharacterized NAD(P)/FAD-binding protein YdhS
MDTKLRGLQLHIRERAAEVEKEIERQRLMELERAKTKELRHSLDMEKERQTQVRTLPHSIWIYWFPLTLLCFFVSFVCLLP